MRLLGSANNGTIIAVLLRLHVFNPLIGVWKLAQESLLGLPARRAYSGAVQWPTRSFRVPSHPYRSGCPDELAREHTCIRPRLVLESASPGAAREDVVARHVVSSYHHPEM
jgi:hypothetical protein